MADDISTLAGKMRHLTLEKDLIVNVNMKKFPHGPITRRGKERSIRIFSESREVGTAFRQGLVYDLDDKKNLPLLNDEICEYISHRSKSKLIGYVGSDLSVGSETFHPVTSEELHCLHGLLKFIAKWEADNEVNYASRSKFTIVSPRHHILDILMIPFGNERCRLVFTAHRGLFVITLAPSQRPTGINSPSSATRKICYTGFELERLLTATSGTERGSFYSFIEAKLEPDITILLQCEMDAYNPKRQKYTEIKSSVDFNVRNVRHLSKLLKIWAQTALLPSTDILVGFRDPSTHVLKTVVPYSVDQIAEKLYIRDRTRSHPSYFNFNPEVAKDWTHYAIREICERLSSLVDATSSSPQSFLVEIDKNLQMKIRPTVVDYSELLGQWA
ncbi:AER404Cp [Eremothecium gossypii ATCC 10895]|uniref:Decapping nuclease n=1 Tax=Eremothecium gossypii (strain ATCC 10895 / CBS 109.51 / FGSC 9923 / NRRL Y-1056) TaxID=284811 RepID=Q755W4_EREGS|nr:AER404Cp [Eremothecium gossypii ATCC 10895]AAS53083.2 AER404Cp [Eremothecium gossypii ATCC 10895]AEY97392.1 FAER404Cp [Eremothecium gossypii FDAG1]